MALATGPTIEGPASDWLCNCIAEFCAALEGDPWGDEIPGRIVITRSYPDALREHLPTAEYDAWKARHDARAGQATGIGMGFVARDGIPTVVVAALPEQTLRRELLSLICHEICETTMADGDGPPTDHHEVMSRILWSEHVVERRRATAFTALGWNGGALDDGHLHDMLVDYQREWPRLRERGHRENHAPDKIYGHWQLLPREFVCTLGRARGGVVAERDQIMLFLDAQNAELADAWRSIEVLLDELFDDPELDSAERDRRSHEQGWIPLFEVLRAEWNSA